jgi:hypothetical protein
MDLDQFAHRLVIVYDENVYGALICVRLQGCVGKAHQSVPRCQVCMSRCTGVAAVSPGIICVANYRHMAIGNYVERVGEPL